MTLAYSDGYLDKILEIYPIRSNPNRKIPFEDEIQIRQAYNEGDHTKLISLLNGVVKVKKLISAAFDESSLTGHSGSI